MPEVKAITNVRLEAWDPNDALLDGWEIRGRVALEPAGIHGLLIMKKGEEPRAVFWDVRKSCFRVVAMGKQYVIL